MYLSALAQSEPTQEVQQETRLLLDLMKQLTSSQTTSRQNWAARRAKPTHSILMRTVRPRGVGLVSDAFAVTAAITLTGSSLAFWKVHNKQGIFKALVVKGMAAKAPSTAALSVVALAVALAGILFVGRSAAPPPPKQDEDAPQVVAVIDDDAKRTKPTDTRKRKVTIQDQTSIQVDGLLVKPIGVVHSIYRLCVGTPRQGLLAPNAHGRIELLGLSPDVVDGLDSFSHIWIVFIFHLNTQAKNSNRIPSKIAPPALGGKKVGVLATRSPHRNNPIGMTLCKLDSITRATKNSNKTYLNVSGLDLVDGTPVVDIKPYVPNYDSVPADQLKVPSWVSDGLDTRRPVNIESHALQQLEQILTENPEALQFYGGQSLDATVEQVATCIAEVLSVDVRSAWQTKKAREGKSQAERASRVQGDYTEGSSECTQQLDNLLIRYTVSQPGTQNRDESEGSGAEDTVLVHSIELRDQSFSTTSRGLQLEFNNETPSLTEPEPMDESQAPTLQETPLVEPENTSTIQPTMQEKEPETVSMIAPTMQGTPLMEPEAISTTEPTMQGTPLVEPESISTTEPTMHETLLMEPEAISTIEPTMQETPLVEPEAISTTEPTMQETPLVEPEAYIMDVTESVVTTAEEESPPLPSVLSPQLLKKAPERNQPVDVAKDDIPTDGEYSELKNYWAKAASKNTPTGLVPEKEARPTKKYFVFSDKPVAGATTKDAPSTPET
jgi:tRNA (adenine37-N6)-methyltransferase